MLEKSGFSVQWLPDDAKVAHDLYFNNKALSKEKSTGLNYPTYAELTDDLTTIASNYPAICKLESAGQSVRGKELWWIKISDNVNTEEAEPEVHYISTLHGNEPIGTVLCLEFIKYLTAGYSSDTEIQNLINTTEIWIMPLMNPDGYDENSPQRFNANGDDLNRSFPDPSSSAIDTYWETEGKPPEVSAIMNWALNHTPVLGASFHSGSLVVNYPFDYTQALCPDNALFEYISLKYAELNPPMYSSIGHGIVRGSLWYEIKGGLQDWTYLATGSNHVTIELNSNKEPLESELTGLWDDNRESMMAYLQSVHYGVKGMVTDKTSGEPVSGWIRVEEIDHAVYTDPDVGDYHRMLVPGDYTLIVRAEGYSSFSQSITIAEGTVLEVDVALDPGEDNSGDTGNNWPKKTNTGGNTSSGGGATPSTPDTDDVTTAGSSSGCFITDIEKNY